MLFDGALRQPSSAQGLTLGGQAVLPASGCQALAEMGTDCLGEGAMEVDPAGDHIAGIEIAIAAGEVGHGTTRLLDEQGAGREIPGRQPQFPETVEQCRSAVSSSWPGRCLRA